MTLGGTLVLLMGSLALLTGCSSAGSESIEASGEVGTDMCSTLSTAEVAAIVESPSDVTVEEPQNPFVIGSVCRWVGGEPEGTRSVYVSLYEVGLSGFDATGESSGAVPLDRIGDEAFAIADFSGNGDQRFMVHFRLGDRAFQLTGQDFPEINTEAVIAAATNVAERL